MEILDNKDKMAVNARNNEDALNRLVIENNSFILRCASKTCKRFITESDDEYEVALVAFCEAVRTFNPDTGHFTAFATLVIRRRLMDYFDSQSRRSREITAGSAMTWENGEDQPTGIIAEVQQKLVQDDQSGTHTVKDEIVALGAVLNDYGFSFFDLAEASPKAGKTKHCCARAVNWMLAVVERILNMRTTHCLPVAAIVKALEIARKIIERHRRYIIAATEILDGDYPYLAEYMDYIKKERSL